MAPTTHCFTPLLGKRIRITEVDNCGAIKAGTSRSVVTDGFVKVSLSAETEDGIEIVQRNAAGNLCVNERFSSTFKNFSVEIEFCGVNPDALSLVTNAKPYKDAAGDTAGFTVPEGPMDKSFALELWTGLSGLACKPGQTGEASGYMLLPFIRAGVFGDIEVNGENATNFTMTGGTTRGGNSWGTGPASYKVVAGSTGGTAAVLPVALHPLDHLLLMDTSIAPPPVACAAAVVAAS